MLSIEDNVLQDITKLIPSSLIKELTCFTFYDNHPKDIFNLDIIVCTKNCELLEYSNRELVLSTRLSFTNEPRDLKILRNSDSELFYLVASVSEVLILSRKNSLQIRKFVTNVERFEIVDPLCCGKINLRIFCCDDAVPLVYNENFELLDNSITPESHSGDSLPIVMQLQRKLVEAQYTVQCNQKVNEDLIKMRQIALATITQRNSLNTDECLIKHTSKVPGGVVIQKPWTAICNKHIIITTKVTNKFNFSIENVNVLLDLQLSCLTYTNKLFEKVHTAPFWKEKHKNSIESQSAVYLVVVLNMKELSDSVSSRVNFEGVVTYQRDENYYNLPFQKVEVTASDLMGDSFDILSNVDEQDSDNLILALLATSERTNLCLRHIRSDGDQAISNLQSVFTQYLQMDILKDLSNVLVHKKSPYHILYGVLIVVENDNNPNFLVPVYSRSQKQVLALIHFIHDAIPFRIISTTPEYQLISKTPQLENYNEDYITKQKLDLTVYSESMLKQSAKILQHFDECMIKMNASKNAAVQCKIGKEIDLYANGRETFDDLRKSILEDIDRSVQILVSGTYTHVDDDIMIIDD